VQVAVGSEGLWRSFAPMVGIDVDDPRFATNGERVARRSDLIAEIEAAFSKDDAETWLARLDGAGVPAGKVRALDDVYEWEQTRSQGLLVEVEHSTLGRITLPGPPLRLDDAAHAGGRASHLAPPTLGQHTESVLAWLDEEQKSTPAGGSAEPSQPRG
jgi:formyl-CoA transferase